MDDSYEPDEFDEAKMAGYLPVAQHALLNMSEGQSHHLATGSQACLAVRNGLIVGAVGILRNLRGRFNRRRAEARIEVLKILKYI